MRLLGGAAAVDRPEKPEAPAQKSEDPAPLNPGDDILRGWVLLCEEIKEKRKQLKALGFGETHGGKEERERGGFFFLWVMRYGVELSVAKWFW